jgi:acyl-CoA hydrolase
MEQYSGDKLNATHSFTVMPKDYNYAEALFGGKLLYELDYAGVKVVRRALYGTGADAAVTAAIDRVDFVKPAFKGDIITMNAQIKSFGKSSIQVRVTVHRESVKGEVEQVCASNLTFVAIKDGKPFKHNLNFEKLQ